MHGPWVHVKTTNSTFRVVLEPCDGAEIYGTELEKESPLHAAQFVVRKEASFGIDKGTDEARFPFPSQRNLWKRKIVIARFQQSTKRDFILGHSRGRNTHSAKSQDMLQLFTDRSTEVAYLAYWNGIPIVTFDFPSHSDSHRLSHT